MKYLFNTKLCIILSTFFLNTQGNKLSRSQSISNLNYIGSPSVDNLSLKRSKSVNILSFRKPQNVNNLSLRMPHPLLCNKFTITYYLYKNKPLYECNNFFFRWHRDVVEYYNSLCYGKIKGKKIIPRKAIDSKKLDPEGLLFRMEEFRYPDIIKSNPFSCHIWTRVWEGCDYYCFAEYNFKFLKEGYVAEINEYRRLHEAAPLEIDHYLQKYAAIQARMSCSYNPTFLKKSKRLGYIGAIYILKKANLLVKNMYDKFLSEYNWNSLIHVGGGTKYSQLIWKNTKKIGIGVCEKGEHIFTTFLFLPKGGYGSFEKNVQPIGQKHLYLYNFFA
uniref:SCP domain-containing protein n=1 Tax=Strongyloides papillosus TaxID=174720 RepID=A0A0N5C8W5_STREA